MPQPLEVIAAYAFALWGVWAGAIALGVAGWLVVGALRGIGAIVGRARRYRAYVPITTGTLTRNEVREIENKLEGLDEPLGPVNITGGAQQVNDTPDDEGGRSRPNAE